MKSPLGEFLYLTTRRNFYTQVPRFIGRGIADAGGVAVRLV